ncbi:valine--tRNA ligase [Candidatus Woesearchaeota archaeon]|nr:valine--tRNA ligase [Candidatus Woesearchaeota archaeon]
MALSDNYDFTLEEKKWQAYWENNKVYQFDPNKEGELYTIDTPPPTVSGAMHIGHAFSYSQQDFIARFQRMSGKNVFYPFGTDDNGLATERLIEKIKKVNSKKMKRSDFIKLCLDTLKEIRPAFIQDWKNMAISCDYKLCYSTIDDNSRKISQKSFVELYNTGLIYKKKAPIIICPQCQTAIAQVEMEDAEQQSFLNYIEAEAEDGEKMVFATTRPELIYACVGMSVHPEDPRYKHLIGKKITLPLTKKQVELIQDEKTIPEFGTGVVYYCTYGGLDCVEWMARHPGVKPIHIMDVSGRYNELAGHYKGMTSKEARKQVVEDLKKIGALKEQKPLKHTVNVHERCGTDIEYVASEQWFVKYLDLREKFLKDGDKLHWYPDHMKHRLFNWIKGLNWDWCISRQRHFGIPIPVWYCKKCNAMHLPDEKQLPVDPTESMPRKPCKCGSKEFKPETDVLDTWATSSLTPQLAQQFFEKHPIKSKLFPMNLRPQAHDIINFWLFYTLVKSQLHYQVNPWHDVMISGFALDPHGKKMSKSKGNVIEPQAMTGKYGADCLRFWAAGSKLGDDLPFQEKDLITGKKMVTKLWNASKFCMMHLQDYNGEKEELKLIDKWLLTKTEKMIKRCTDAFNKYEYAQTKAEVEKFFWQIMCDNYVEIVKDRLYNPDKRGHEARVASQYVLYHGLLTTLKLLAPIMPHITEAVYQGYFAEKEKYKSIHNSSWPSHNKKEEDNKAEFFGDIFVAIVGEVRKIKSENNVSLKHEVKMLTIECEKDVKKALEAELDDLEACLNIKKVNFGKATRQVADNVKISVEMYLKTNSVQAAQFQQQP